MDDIEELSLSLGITRQEAQQIRDADLEAQAEREARGCCGRCKHFVPDPEAGRAYFGEPNEDMGWCKHLEVKPDRNDLPGAAMLSGDWCQKFEQKE